MHNQTLLHPPESYSRKLSRSQASRLTNNIFPILITTPLYFFPQITIISSLLKNMLEFITYESKALNLKIWELKYSRSQ